MALRSLLIISLAMAAPSFAAEGIHPTCLDLAKAACGSEANPDGTEAQMIQGASMDERFRGAVDKFKGILAKPESANLRRDLLASSGLAMLPDCQKAIDQPVGRCLDLLANAATDYLRWGHHMASLPDGQGRALASIDERYYLLQRPEFLAMQKEFGRAPQTEAAVNKMAMQVKAVLLAKIKEKIKEPSIAKLMIQRVAGLSIEGVDCSSAQDGEAPKLLAPDVRYQVSSRTIKFCRESFATSHSDLEMAYLFAKEMAHAIDPCNIARGPKESTLHYRSTVANEAEKEYPVGRLLTCLREVGMGGEVAKSELPNGLTNIMTPAWPYVASQKNEDVVMCNHDSISDVAADWWAAEVLPVYLNKHHANLTPEQKRAGYANAVRHVCPPKDFMNLKAGSSMDRRREERVNKLLLSNPQVRAHLGCPPQLPQGQVYCSGEAVADAGLPALKKQEAGARK